MFRKRIGRPSPLRKNVAVGRRGFTLAEVLVTLAIIAIMAAVLLPALNSQISKGETGRLASDLTTIQVAAQAFVSDVHRYPSTVAQLTTSGSGSDINSTTIPSTLAAKWKGPYISKDIFSSTGAGATLSQTFTVTTITGTVQYLTVSVLNLAAADYANIESTLDEGTPSTGSTTAGVVRYSSTNSTLSFLALPIQ